jgi:hypothetical protein
MIRFRSRESCEDFASQTSNKYYYWSACNYMPDVWRDDMNSMFFNQDSLEITLNKHDGLLQSYFRKKTKNDKEFRKLEFN